MQSVVMGLPLHHGCGEASWGRRTERDVRVGTPGAEGKGRGEEARDWGAGRRGRGGGVAAPSHPLLQSFCRRGVGCGGGFSFPLFFPLSFLCNFLGACYIFLGQAWTGGKGELATSRRRASCGRCVRCHDPPGRIRLMTKGLYFSSV